jgi:hypothetical protein
MNLSNIESLYVPRTMTTPHCRHGRSRQSLNASRLQIVSPDWKVANAEARMTMLDGCVLPL